MTAITQDVTKPITELDNISERKAYAILFLEGIASVSLQMLVLRQVMPVSGASILHTSIVVGVFLAALAYGYYVGGKVNHTKFLERLSLNLAISIPVFGFGLSTVFVGAFFGGLTSIGLHPLVSLSVYSLVIMAPLVFVLAQTVPLLINGVKTNTHSEAAGNAYSISTIGNVLGALVTSLVMLYYLGTGFAIALNILMLLACYALIQPKYKASTIAVFFLAVLTMVLNINSSKTMFLTSNQYSDIYVASAEQLNVREEERGDFPVMVINNSLSSKFDVNTNTAWEYIESMKQRLVLKRSHFDNPNPSALILGAGGFTISANIEDDYNYTYIDVDPDLKLVAETHLLKQPINGKFIVSDARLHLQHSKDLHEMIIVDTYSNHFTIPSHLATQEFHKLVNERLTQNGEAVINLIGSSTFSDEYTRRMDATLRAVYNSCVSNLISPEQEISNIIYFCQKRESNINAQVFIDDNVQVSVASISF